MLTWAARHWVLTWAIAWAATGLGLFIGDVFSNPRRGPLWPAIAFGLAGWGLAGALTLHSGRLRLGLLTWGSAYSVAFVSAAILGNWFESNQVGPFISAGFIGALLGWATGAAWGAFFGAYISASRKSLLSAIVIAAAWGLGFLFAGYFGLVAAMYGAQFSKGALASLGNQRIALAIGWTSGCALAGALAPLLGMAAEGAIRRLARYDAA